MRSTPVRSRRLALAAILAVVALLASACGGGDGTASARTVDVSLSDFTITPSGEARAGSPLTLRVHNEGKVPHALALQAGDRVFETRTLGPNSFESLQIPALAAGTYTMWCTIAGHRAAGMETTLTVTEPAPAAAQTSGPLTPAQIDADHEAGVKAFPAKTQGLGGRVLEPVLVDGVKEFHLTAKAIRWEVTPGQFVDAYAYNDQVPGPEIRVRRGDKIRVVFHNQLPESSTVHYHGVTVPNAMDGVGFVTQPAVRTGRSFTYEFPIVDEPGTYMYHAHHNSTVQVGKGLLGAFIVEPEARSWDVEQSMVLGDGPLGYTINGKGWPATSPIVTKVGQSVLIRFLNEGQILHPMHLHGFHFSVVARDGHPIDSPYELDTVVVAPGERYDVLFTASLPGVWVLHCHILSHAESEHGFHGMTTAVFVR